MTRGTKQDQLTGRRARRARRTERRVDPWARSAPRGRGTDVVRDTRLSSAPVSASLPSRAWDIYGHAGYVLIATGSLLIANHRAEGYFLHLVAAVIWIHIGVRVRMSSLWFWEAICIGTATYGYLNWTDQLPSWFG